MGQKYSVTIFRYIIDNSVEKVSAPIPCHPVHVPFEKVLEQDLTGSKNIADLQRRKQNLAKYTLDSASGDGLSSGLDVCPQISEQ